MLRSLKKTARHLVSRGHGRLCELQDCNWARGPILSLLVAKAKRERAAPICCGRLSVLVFPVKYTHVLGKIAFSLY